MSFNLPEFLPYLLNQAAESVSLEFQNYYRENYGMLRSEWRVLFHLGCYENMTAKRICEMGSIHKTKVSRAVHALEKKRFLKRRNDEHDRRIEHLELTKLGEQVFLDLRDAAEAYDARITSSMSDEQIKLLRRVLTELANLDRGSGED